MEELITVIINVYNGEKFIKKCLESIINQTYKNLEILIINDGSTDSTQQICESYEDERIRIINQENMGLSKARNVGIENAKGDFLYFIDADDYIELDTIAYLYNMYKKYHTTICTCRPIDVYDYDIKIKKCKEKVDVLDSVEMLKKVLLSTDRSVTIWNKLIKKDLFQNIKFEDRLMDDLAVTHKLVISASKIAYSNQIKYYYLRHKNATTAKEIFDIDRSIDYYLVTYDRYKYIKELYPSLVENNINMLRTIAILYLRSISELDDFLNNQNALKLFKKVFTFKVITCKLSFKEKTKIILFRISPKLCKFIYKKYQSSNTKYKM